MKNIIEYLFWQGTDFCINMANLLGITYDEFNIALFIFLMPAVLVVLLALNILKLFRRSK